MYGWRREKENGDVSLFSLFPFFPFFSLFRPVEEKKPLSCLRAFPGHKNNTLSLHVCTIAELVPVPSFCKHHSCIASPSSPVESASIVVVAVTVTVAVDVPSRPLLTPAPLPLKTRRMISIPALIKQIVSSFQVSRSSRNQLPALETSFNPIPNFKNLPKNLQNARWSTILHFSLLLVVFAFSISIMRVPIFAKLIVVVVLVFINFSPIFSQFFTNGLPILAWVFLFFNSQFIPLSMKRPISVKVLPILETIFYGDNLSEILASKTNTFLDVLSWLPYGLIHFALPFVVAFLIFVFAPPQTLPQFCWSFGFMNLSGVFVQNMVFSCAPPWYKVLHGLEKANYSMKGSPGGLGRIDQLIGFDMYTTGFTNSPLIFGAMPSLHSGCSTMDALWLTYLLPKGAPIWISYVIWLWFSTMYLTHHYFIDVVAGSCLAVFFFYCVKWRGKLPINDKFCRWDYDSLTFHNIWNEDPLKSSDFFADIDDNHPMSSPSPYDLENQIPLNDLSSSSVSNNVITNGKFDGSNNGKANLSNSKPNNINNNKNKKSDVESDPNLDSEKRDIFYSDDEIAEAYDIEKSAHTTTKTVPKMFKESFEVTLSTSQQNRDSEDTNVSNHIQSGSSTSNKK